MPLLYGIARGDCLYLFCFCASLPHMSISDRDVLSELLLCPDANVHIIYHNKKALADKIANVVKIIGQDKLIEKSYSENPQIDFIEQK